MSKYSKDKVLIEYYEIADFFPVKDESADMKDPAVGKIKLDGLVFGHAFRHIDTGILPAVFPDNEIRRDPVCFWIVLKEKNEFLFNLVSGNPESGFPEPIPKKPPALGKGKEVSD